MESKSFPEDIMKSSEGKVLRFAVYASSNILSTVEQLTGP